MVVCTQRTSGGLSLSLSFPYTLKPSNCLEALFSDDTASNLLLCSSRVVTALAASSALLNWAF